MKKLLVGVLVLALAGVLGMSLATAQDKPMEKVMIGTSPALSSAGIFIAIEKGYLAEEGIDADATTFHRSGGELLPSLIKGDLDVGAGNVSAGIYNAFNDGHGLQIVADKGRVAKDHGYLALMSANKHVPDGDISKFKLQKGFKVSTTGPGVSQEVVYAKWAKHYGIDIEDLEIVNLPLPGVGAALGTDQIDASIMIEPFIANSIEQDLAVKIAGDEEIYPDQQSAVILFSPKFVAERPAVAQKVAKAYVRALRDYNDAFEYGVGKEEIIKILMKYTSVKDRAAYDKIVPAFLHPDGAMNLESLAEDVQFFRDRGYIKKPVDVSKVVNTTWIENAVKELGPYQPPKK
ncbi:MAG: ABC transporter substrate-binding protein [Deltaproteobacteria bacterium]|nr:ABC transporter substrate-binding protein [Deltaproteobacteria bacterium]